jgi:hypothetical protein
MFILRRNDSMAAVNENLWKGCSACAAAVHGPCMGSGKEGMITHHATDAEKRSNDRIVSGLETEYPILYG